MKPVEQVRAYAPPCGDEPEEQVVAPPAIALRIFSILVPLFFILFFLWHAAALIETLRISILIILAKAALEIQFYVRRSTESFVSTSAYAWLIALCGALVPLMFRPVHYGSDFSVATVIQAIGLAMLIYVISTLNRNCGMAVARHGIRRDGLYRFVRHPLFLALMVSEYAYVLNHTTFYNLLVLAFATFFQVLRIREEERLLLDDEDFQRYAHQIRWRVIPGMF